MCPDTYILERNGPARFGKWFEAREIGFFAAMILLTIFGSRRYFLDVTITF